MKRRNLLTSSAGLATLPLLTGVSLVTASVAEADVPGHGPWPPPPSYNGLILDGIEGSVYPFFRPWKGKRPFPRPRFKGTVRVTQFGYKRGLSCDGFIYGNLVNPWGKP